MLEGDAVKGNTFD